LYKTVTGGSFKVFSQEDIQAIHQETLNILEKTGIRVHNARAREIFADSGAEVSRQEGTVRIPRSMVEEAISSAPSSVVLCGREEKNDLLLEKTNTYLGTGGTVLNTLDLESGERRLTEVRDVADYARITDCLENVAFFVINCYPDDVPTEDVDVNRFYHSLANTSKHVMGGIYTMPGLKNVIAMAEDIAGGRDRLLERPFLSFITLMMSPLVMEQQYTDFLIEVAKYGLPIATPSEPLAGATSPVTLAGTVTINNIESLAGLILVQMINPGNPTLYGSTSSIMDPRAGIYVAGCIESALINAGCAQMAQHYEIPIYATGGMSDSKIVDCQSGYEKAATAITVAMSGANFIHDAAGLLEFCTTLSYEQMVIDNDILGISLRATRGIEVSPETIAADVIQAVGPGGNFLGEEHSFRHVRSELYIPSVADRNTRDRWEKNGSPDTHSRAREKARQLLKEHQPLGFSGELDQNLLEKYKGIKKRRT